MEMFAGIILYIISLIILYLVIRAAVKDGINRSTIGKSSYNTDENSNSSIDHFLKNDLDN